MLFDLLDLSDLIIGNFLIFIALGLLVYLFFYLFFTYTHYKIGQKLGVSSWLAFFPVLQNFYIPILAGYEWYYGIFLYLFFIPHIGGLITLFATAFFYVKICEKFEMDKYMGLLSVIPIMNFILYWKLAFNAKVRNPATMNHKLNTHFGKINTQSNTTYFDNDSSETDKRSQKYNNKSNNN